MALVTSYHRCLLPLMTEHSGTASSAPPHAVVSAYWTTLFEFGECEEATAIVTYST